MTKTDSMQALRVFFIAHLNQIKGPQNLKEMTINCVHQMNDEQLTRFAVEMADKDFPALLDEVRNEYVG